MGSKLGWFMVIFCDMHFISHHCFSEEENTYTMKYSERAVHFSLCLSVSVHWHSSQVSVKLIEAPSALPHLPNIMLLSVVRFPWAGCLFSISLTSLLGRLVMRNWHVGENVALAVSIQLRLLRNLCEHFRKKLFFFFPLQKLNKNNFLFFTQIKNLQNR